MGNSTRPVLLLSGAAAGFGASLAGAFSAAGHDIVGLSRSSAAAAQIARAVEPRGGTYIHLECDITRPDEVAQVLQPHADSVAVLVHNAAALLIREFGATTVEEFEQVWRVGCLGAVTTAKVVLPRMAARGAGTVILSGATAGRRGAAKFSAFASAKFALRGLAQSLAREYGPKGVHVAHVVLDGLLDEPQTDQRFGPAQSARMNTDAVARAYLSLATQHPSVWTHELDLRPSAEHF